MIAVYKKQLVLVLMACVFVACVKPNSRPTDKPLVTKPVAKDCNCAVLQSPTAPLPSTDKTDEAASGGNANLVDYSGFKPAKWEDIDGFLEDDLSQSWAAWLQSCSTLSKQSSSKQSSTKQSLSKQPLVKNSSANNLNNDKPQWQAACAAANKLIKPNNATIIAYLTNQFNVYSVVNKDGSQSGLITGYYQPLLQGSLKQSSQYPYPLYSEPDDLITVELADLYPDLKFKRLRGRLENIEQNPRQLNGQSKNKQKLIPYFTRAEIEAQASPLAGSELIWINDILDVFFLHIQGSGLINLDNGQQVHVGYANQNGHAYYSIGKLLIERGELTIDQASMEGIKNWARNHLGQLRNLLNSNPSYVFFRLLPDGLPGPIGALGVPITAERSLAIDPKYIPLGAPLFLSTTQPNSTTPLKRLMVAQDTGGAIKGAVRADYFWGVGDIAGKKAGAMKQPGKMWIFLPKDYVIKP